MQNVSTSYSADELAWVSRDVTIPRDIYLMISLNSPGKVVIRQKSSSGEWPMLPIRRHKDTKDFTFRIQVNPPFSTIRIYTSKQPKEIKYAYI